MKLVVRSAIIVLIATATVCAVEAESPVETFYQHVDIQRSPRFSTAGLNVSQQIHYQLQSLFEVYGEDDRGNHKVTQTVSDTRLLKADPLSEAVFRQSLAEMKGQKFTYTINKFAEVVSMTGHQDKTTGQRQESKIKRRVGLVGDRRRRLEGTCTADTLSTTAGSTSRQIVCPQDDSRLGQLGQLVRQNRLSIARQSC